MVLVRSLQLPLSLLATHPTAFLGYVPEPAALFTAGAVAGAVAKTLTAPLDRVKLLLQVSHVNPGSIVGKNTGFLEAFTHIAKQEGVLAFWKGNIPQVVRILPYTGIQLGSYEFFKRMFAGKDKPLQLHQRLAAGACAGIVSTAATYPLDTIRFRMAVDPTATGSMLRVASNIVRTEGILAMYKGIGPSLLGIAPYIAINFAAFDLLKKASPEQFRKNPTTSLVSGLVAALLATGVCYPLDTVRRQIQMRGSPYHTVQQAVSGIIKEKGVQGLYSGFGANAIKNLPNSSVRLATYDAAKLLLAHGRSEAARLEQTQPAEHRLGTRT
eukprot:jgi/Chlat1/5372/Chrsp35S05215